MVSVDLREVKIFSIFENILENIEGQDARENMMQRI